MSELHTAGGIEPKEGEKEDDEGPDYSRPGQRFDALFSSDRAAYGGQ